MPIRTAVKETCYGLLTRAWGGTDRRVPVRVRSGPCKSLRLRLDLVGRCEGSYLWGKYDRNILEQLSGIIQPGWTTWDCGTYLGFYTLFFARAVGPQGTVVAIEPDPRNLDRTREHCALNGFRHVVFEHAAVGAPRGLTDFFVSDDTNSHLAGGYYAGAESAKAIWAEKEKSLSTIAVPCLSLDQLFLERSLPTPDLIKLDIEGAEKDALQHVSGIVKAHRPLIVLELHNPDCDAAAWQFSRDFDYRLRSLDTGRTVECREDTFGTLLCSPS